MKIYKLSIMLICMKKQIILPLASLIFITLIFFAIIIPVSRDFLTGLVIMPQQYSIEGQIKITTPVELYDNCNINISLENEKTKEVREKIISSQEFKLIAKMSKEESFIYIAQLSDLTKDIIFEKGSYFITLRVFCDDNLISQTQEYFTTD